MAQSRSRIGGAARAARSVLVPLACVAAVSCSSGRVDPNTEAIRSEPPGASPLAPGDAVRLAFSREPELNGEFTIDETGFAVLPLLGVVLLTDRPASVVKTDLTATYEERIRNQSVQVVYLRRVRVLGEVQNPGLHLVDPTMTFDDVIALAGGRTNEGNLSNVSLVRRDGETIEGIDVLGTVPGTLGSGDQVYVPKTSWFSRNGAVIIGATISAIGFIVALTR